MRSKHRLVKNVLWSVGHLEFSPRMGFKDTIFLLCGSGLFSVDWVPLPWEGEQYQFMVSAASTNSCLHGLWVAKCDCEQHKKNDSAPKNRLLREPGT